MKFLRLEAVIIFAFIWLQMLGGFITDLTYVGLIFYALINVKTALKALTLGVLLLFLNPALFPGSDYQLILRWVLLLAAIVRIYLNWLVLHAKVYKWFLYLLIFSIASILLAFLNSYYVTVSIVKSIILFLGLSAIILGFIQSKNTNWHSWFFTLFCVVLMSGIPLVFMPEGYYRNQRDFQGILNHPQAYGVYMVIPTLWLTGLVFSEISKTKGVKTKGILILPIVLAWITIFLSNARVAMFAALLAVLLSLAFKARLDLKKAVGSFFKKPLFISILLLGIILAVFQSEIIVDRTTRFIFGGHYFQETKGIQAIGEAFYASRGFLIMKSWNNFKEHPWTGIGLGVPSDLDFGVEKTEMFGIPIGAPVEKGFLPSALLEEVGIIGSFLFVFFLLTLAKPVLKQGKLPVVWLFFCSIFVNFGEMIFFSPGGLGLHTWLFLGFAFSSSIGSLFKKE